LELLTERQERLLALIVHEYVELANPVGSNHIVDKFNLGISSATVRNEMAALTEAGLLRQPHTSAGRVPTEKGYRYFVRNQLSDSDLPNAEKRMISHQFLQAPADIEEWVRLAASVLAQQSRVASLVTVPKPSTAFFKHLEMIATQGQHVLMVLVLQGGDVRQQMLTLKDSYEQEHLTKVAATINQLAMGKGADEIGELADSETDLGADILRLVSQLMGRADEERTGHVYRDGLTNVLAQPEFSDSDSARSALRLFEENAFLEDVLFSVLSPSIGGVQVVIGGEGAWEELKECSIVLSRYGAPGSVTGAVGVLGPTRMAYGRSISAVRYVASLLSNLVVDTYTGS
jgi:heat-inducible transcriptional repressor